VQIEVDTVERPAARSLPTSSPTIRSNASLVTCADGLAEAHAVATRL
jgi:hypothetical protein